MARAQPKGLSRGWAFFFKPTSRLKYKVSKKVLIIEILISHYSVGIYKVLRVSFWLGSCTGHTSTADDGASDSVNYTTCVQVGAATLKCRPDRQNLRPPHQISLSLSYFNYTFHLTFYHESVSNPLQKTLKHNIYYFKELYKLSVTRSKYILIV